ncbi:MAG: four helix bundle protein [Thermodesulfovibrionales bacterium]|jgi:four helix bundle protein
MGYQNFKELRVWQEAKGLAINVYRLTSEGRLSRDFGLKEQIQRSSVSIASNIAEGYERNSDKDFVRFLLIAKGSLAELRTQLEIAKGIGYVDENAYNDFENQCNKIGAMLTKLIQARKTVSR